MTKRISSKIHAAILPEEGGRSLCTLHQLPQASLHSFLSAGVTRRRNTWLFPTKCSWALRLPDTFLHPRRPSSIKTRLEKNLFPLHTEDNYINHILPGCAPSHSEEEMTISPWYKGPLHRLSRVEKKVLCQISQPAEVRWRPWPNTVAMEIQLRCQGGNPASWTPGAWGWQQNIQERKTEFDSQFLGCPK